MPTVRRCVRLRASFEASTGVGQDLPGCVVGRFYEGWGGLVASRGITFVGGSPPSRFRHGRVRGTSTSGALRPRHGSPTPSRLPGLDLDGVQVLTRTTP